MIFESYSARRLVTVTVATQMSAHSMHSRMHLTISDTSCSPKSASTSAVQAWAQSLSASMVGTIHGGGTANMTDLVAAGFKGVSSFGFEATLFSDGSARGHFDCVDHMGDLPGYPGNVFGDITRWSSNADGTLTLFVTNGSLVGTHGGFVAHGGLAFAVTIQHFGGAGVGHWTLDFPGVVSPFNGGPICQELLTSGQIVVRWN
ncbi:MAG: hypothetical protein E6I11_03735 [Chloroflexi bacterium]|nr:MAG: hypothetical protein E6I11_03735 [Chloroflexota bacterium]